MRARLLPQALLLSAFLVLQPIAARATIFTWNAGSGTTDTGVNWNPVGLPGPNDATRFWQVGITYGITTVSTIDTFSTVWASGASTLKLYGDDPIRVRNSFQVDGGVNASVLSGMARAGWFAVGPGTLSISGNGVQAISTSSAHEDDFGTTSGSTSTVNVGGGASFSGFTIRVPQVSGATGILHVAGRPLGGIASSLHTTDVGGTGDLDVGSTGTGVVEVSASASMKVDRLLWLGSMGTGHLRLWRGVGTGLGPPSLSVTANVYIGDNEQPAVLAD